MKRYVARLLKKGSPVLVAHLLTLEKNVLKKFPHQILYFFSICIEKNDYAEKRSNKTTET
jgi:hypothetical protein